MLVTIEESLVATGGTLTIFRYGYSLLGLDGTPHNETHRVPALSS